jgi:hypothetical protein
LLESLPQEPAAKTWMDITVFQVATVGKKSWAQRNYAFQRQRCKHIITPRAHFLHLMTTDRPYGRDVVIDASDFDLTMAWAAISNEIAFSPSSSSSRTDSTVRNSYM